MIATCDDGTVTEGRRSHTWEQTGLDVIGDELCTTRRCLRCPLQQHKRYGAGGRKPWKDTTP